MGLLSAIRKLVRNLKPKRHMSRRTRRRSRPSISYPIPQDTGPGTHYIRSQCPIYEEFTTRTPAWQAPQVVQAPSSDVPDWIRARIMAGDDEIASADEGSQTCIAAEVNGSHRDPSLSCDYPYVAPLAIKKTRTPRDPPPNPSMVLDNSPNEGPSSALSSSRSTSAQASSATLPTPFTMPPPPEAPRASKGRQAAKKSPPKPSSTSITKASLHLLLSTLHAAIGHIPYIITGRAALLLWGCKIYALSHVTIICAVSKREVVQCWAMTSAGLTLESLGAVATNQEGKETDRLLVHVGKDGGAIRRLRIRYVGDDEFLRIPKGNVYEAWGCGARYDNVMALPGLLDFFVKQWMDNEEVRVVKGLASAREQRNLVKEQERLADDIFWILDCCTKPRPLLRIRGMLEDTAPMLWRGQVAASAVKDPQFYLQFFYQHASWHGLAVFIRAGMLAEAEHAMEYRLGTGRFAQLGSRKELGVVSNSKWRLEDFAGWRGYVPANAATASAATQVNLP